MPASSVTILIVPEIYYVPGFLDVGPVVLSSRLCSYKNPTM
jgi:hypothetical protein